jgi:predicted RNase H-like HicB family nuclease
MKLKHHAYRLTVVVERDEDGLYIATCPVLQGCYTQGKSIKEATENIRDAIKLHIEARKKTGDYLPHEISATKIQIAA